MTNRDRLTLTMAIVVAIGISAIAIGDFYLASVIEKANSSSSALLPQNDFTNTLVSVHRHSGKALMGLVVVQAIALYRVYGLLRHRTIPE